MEYRKDPELQHMCERILDRASKYNVQLLELDNEGKRTIRQSMSPIIFSNVGKRGMRDESDRLAVIANCLGYFVRLDSQRLEREAYSLSISMLALFLLNGEILMNGPDNSQSAIRSNIFDYLRSQSLRTFQTPDIDQKLKFIKSCRFTEVELSEQGVNNVWSPLAVGQNSRGSWENETATQRPRLSIELVPTNAFGSAR